MCVEVQEPTGDAQQRKRVKDEIGRLFGLSASVRVVMPRFTNIGEWLAMFFEVRLNTTLFLGLGTAGNYRARTAAAFPCG